MLVIALLALARKRIVFDRSEIEADELIGPAAITLALAVVCRRMRERDDRAGAPLAGG